MAAFLFLIDPIIIQMYFKYQKMKYKINTNINLNKRTMDILNRILSFCLSKIGKFAIAVIIISIIVTLLIQGFNNAINEIAETSKVIRQ